METAWVQVFILSLTECVAPAGKTICQESQLDIEFLSRQDCELALEQLMSLKQAAENVIIDPSSASCTISARQRAVFATLDDARVASRDLGAWSAPDAQQRSPDYLKVSHQERLDTLPNCEENDGVAPCKVGQIIVEQGAPTNNVDVWRRDE